MTPVNLEDCREGCIAWCHPSRLHELPHLSGGYVFAPLGTPHMSNVTIMEAKDPKAAMAQWIRDNYAIGSSRIHIGEDTDIHATAIIAGGPFDYAGGARFPAIGGVVIGDRVSIGAHACIDRGSIGDTIIGDGTKIDNLVHVGHNATIGRDCIIVAGTVIGGWCKIGDNVRIGIGAMIRNRITIGDGAYIGMGSVVVKDVPPGVTVKGNPAR